MTFIIHILTIFFRIITAFFEMLRVSSRLACITFAALLALFVSTAATAQTLILRVDIENGSITGDGSAWGSDAYRFLQDALDVAAANPQNEYEIWVAQGTYRPDQWAANSACGEGPLDWPNCCPPYGNCDDSEAFEISAVALYGGFPPDPHTWNNNQGAEFADRDPWAFPTILSGDLWGDDDPMIHDNGELVLFFAKYTDNSNLLVEMKPDDSTLDGFTVRGAIHVSGAEARLRDCIFDVSEGPALRFSRGSSAQIWRCRLASADGESLIDRIIVETDARVFVDALAGFLPSRARSAER